MRRRRGLRHDVDGYDHPGDVVAHDNAGSPHPDDLAGGQLDLVDRTFVTDHEITHVFLNRQLFGRV
ncbi:hypothetical protein, partial [Aeromicrobium sp.]|uniref:hypothetical protein n=1 Tax=Aeromicrobium sp. TaxID=1871063 RepID=UPI0025B973D5